MRLLAFFTLIDAIALSGYVTRSETVKTQVIQPQSRHHLVSTHGFEGRTQVQWMFFGLANCAADVCSSCERSMLVWLSTSTNRITLVNPLLMSLIWGQSLGSSSIQVDEVE